jgi:hypothetical protein
VLPLLAHNPVMAGRCPQARPGRDWPASPSPPRGSEPANPSRTSTLGSFPQPPPGAPHQPG